MANTNRFYVHTEGETGHYFENAEDAIESIKDYPGNVDILSDQTWAKSKNKNFNDGVNLGSICGGVACILAGIGGFIYDAWRRKKKK